MKKILIFLLALVLTLPFRGAGGELRVDVLKGKVSSTNLVDMIPAGLIPITNYVSVPAMAVSPTNGWAYSYYYQICGNTWPVGNNNNYASFAGFNNTGNGGTLVVSRTDGILANGLSFSVPPTMFVGKTQVVNKFYIQTTNSCISGYNCICYMTYVGGNGVMVQTANNPAVLHPVVPVGTNSFTLLFTNTLPGTNVVPMGSWFYSTWTNQTAGTFLINAIESWTK